jgi:hypothetical protein
VEGGRGDADQGSELPEEAVRQGQGQRRLARQQGPHPLVEAQQRLTHDAGKQHQEPAEVPPGRGSAALLADRLPEAPFELLLQLLPGAISQLF